MSDLRIAVLGVGVMGADHVARITEPDQRRPCRRRQRLPAEKAEQVAAAVPGPGWSTTRSTRPSPTTSTRCVLATPGLTAREAAAGLPRSTASRCCARSR